MKKICSALMAAIMMLPLLSGCNVSPESGSVYFLNFKPEQDAAYQTIAAEYTALTGIPVKVATTANGTYEQQLLNQLTGADAPTIFQINGPGSYTALKPYTANLARTDLYQRLTEKSVAIMDGSAVVGVPFVIEGYGIIVNQKIMSRYFETPEAKISNIAEINSFARLKEVVEDMQAKRTELGITGVFASTSLMPGQEWRWQTHLANVAFYYEWAESKANLTKPAATAQIDFKYGEQFRQLFDLYLHNSTISPMMTGFKNVEDSMQEFALGQAAMVQNGNWSYNQILVVPGHTVQAEDMAFIPLYIGAPGEENQGLCIGTENFFCINKKASKSDQQASLDFLTWLFTTEAGKSHVMNDLGFIAPFDSFSAADRPKDPLGQQVIAWSAREDVRNVPWNFIVFPGQRFKDDFGAMLLLYAQGQRTWAQVEDEIRSAWAAERAL